MQRIRIILCSVKLRVLNPKLHKQHYIREIKKNDTSQTSTQTSSRMFASSRAQVVVSPPKKVRAFTSSFQSRFWSSTSSRVSGGCWDFSSFVFVVRVSRLFIIIIIICRRLRAGSREIISFLVFEILSVCRRRAFDDATMRHRTLFGRRF